jgi:hypothetical protein
LKDLYLETCCQNKYLTRREYVEEEMKKDAIYSRKEVIVNDNRVSTS